MKYRPTTVLSAPRAIIPARRLAVSYQAVGIVVALAEAIMIVVGGASGPIVYHWIAGIDPVEPGTSIHEGLLSSLFYVWLARSKGLYRLPMLIAPGRHLARIAGVCASVLLSITAILFLLKIGSAFSRGAFLGFAALMLGLCVLTRLGAADIVRALIEKGAVLGRPAVLIGETEELASLSSAFLLRQFGLREVGRVALDAASEDIGQDRRIEEALAQARRASAQELVLATTFDRVESLAAIEDALRVSPLPVRLVPNRVFRSVIARHASNRDASLHLIDLQRAPLGLVEQAAKRLVDIIGASLALVLLAPILLLAACAITLDSPGPVIFRQRRNGFNENGFLILKFRTMTVLEDGRSIVQARPGDRRVTRVGRILRRTSVDELPQLLNVLRGEMSLVGPRPHAIAHDDHYKAVIGDYCMRHHMKPGITGWAQVNGLRGETARTEQMQRRIELDLWYIDNWSLSLDLRILLRTCLETMRQDAY